MSVDVRTLALEAGVALRTAFRSLQRLEVKGLVERSGRGSSRSSGAFVLSTGHLKDADQDGAGKPSNSSPVDWYPLDSSYRIRSGWLGKLEEAVIDVLYRLGRATRGEMASHISPERKGEALKKPLRKLKEIGVVVPGEEGRYSLAPGWQERLGEELEANGAVAAQRRDKSNYDAQREAYRLYLGGDRMAER